MAEQEQSTPRGPQIRGPRGVREGMEAVFEGKIGPFSAKPGQHHGGGFAGRPRSRGGKAPLSREAVVNAAIACLELDGPDGVTMRAVARTLETGPSSLYAHVANQRELYGLILERVASSVPPVPEDLRGADAAEWLALAIGRAYGKFPGSAGLALTSSAFGEAGLDMFERMLVAVGEMGLADTEAFRAVDTLNLLVTAAYAEADARAREPHGNRGNGDMADLLAMSESSRPRLEAFVNASVGMSDVERNSLFGVDWGVRTFINGLRQ